VSHPHPIVAIDGPAGSGKSTLARRLALELHLPYVNTGLMYRALARRAVDRGIDADDASALEGVATSMAFDLDRTVDPASLVIDGVTPGDDLTDPDVESTVSRVARHPQVRDVLRARQRALIDGGAVVEGRDIGSVVAPDAEVKLYLEADQGERIDRRADERDGGRVADALVARDRADAATNPFVPADDAVAIDTTNLDRDDVFDAAMAIVRAKLSELDV
jgi:cytidylate kinase